MQLTKFIQALTAIFDRERIRHNDDEIDFYLQNVCAGKRQIVGIVFPQTVNEILQLLDIAKEFTVPLYPLSRGYNLGLGSRLPVQDNHLIVDLSRMNRILAFDAELGTITIEPGVSQHAIASYLQQQSASFILNVTGSSADSSVVGNALERGIAHYGTRVTEVLGMDILLGDGRKISLGSSSLTNHSFYAHGLGPDLKGLFFQSNYGIVVSMTLRLLPKTECVALISLEKKPLVPIDVFIDQLRIAKNKHLLPDNLHISNEERRLSVVTPLLARFNQISLFQAKKIAEKHIKSDWTANTSLRGEKKIVRVQSRLIKDFFRKIANVSLLTDMPDEINSPYLTAIKGTIGHAYGIPNSDALLSLGYGINELITTSETTHNAGTLFLVPVLPFRGVNFVEVISCIYDLFKKYQFEAYMTFNLVEHLSLEGVINLIFSKEDANSVQRAHECIQKTFHLLEKFGYPPLRQSIFQTAHVLSEENNNTKLRKQLKKLFDPNNIIALGRYE